MSRAFLFPGQGSQQTGMGELLFSQFPEIVAEADEILGYCLKDLCLNPENSEKLGHTQFTQPALYVVSSLQAMNELGGSGAPPIFLAGHSVGEYAALATAKAFSFSDGLKLVAKRGEIMAKVSGGGMAAVIGMPLGSIRLLCDRISKEDFLVQPANINSHEQIVIAGHLKAVEEVSQLAKEGGAKKTIMLPVSAPFHCPLMKPAEINLKKELEKTEFMDHQYPVISNIQARPLTTGSSACDALVRQVCSPVRWAETMQYLIDQEINIAIELGTGKVLSGLMRRFNNNIKCFQVGDPDSLKTTVEACKNLLKSRNN